MSADDEFRKLEDLRQGALQAAPFFIVGSGRSGSTLLRTMLASHSRISIPPETWYIAPLIAQLPLDRPLSSVQIEDAVSVMTNHYRWPDLGLEIAEFRILLSALRQPWLKDIIEAVYKWYVTAEGKVRWGDKTPNYIEILPTLAKMFPDARFIHLIRDGRDVSKSFQRRGWYGPWLHENTKEWIRALECDWRWNVTGMNSRTLRVHYEQLVLDPERTLKDICRFLGENFEPGMMTWKRKVVQAVPARERGIHTKLTEDPGIVDVGRWKREMTDREIFVAESFMATWLTRYGYELQYKGPLWRSLFGLTRAYCRAVLPAISLQQKLARSIRTRALRLFN